MVREEGLFQFGLYCCGDGIAKKTLLMVKTDSPLGVEEGRRLQTQLSLYSYISTGSTALEKPLERSEGPEFNTI